MLDGVIVNLHSVVRGTPSRWSLIRNDSRITNSPRIYTKSLEIIVAEQFTGDFGYTIHCVRPLNGILWGFIQRSGWAKRADGTWGKNGALIGTRHF